MPEVLRRLDPDRREAIETLKDKVAFRTALRDRYPDRPARETSPQPLIPGLYTNADVSTGVLHGSTYSFFAARSSL